jgi:3D (Asp-Asp-Asp) domain-containing protein
MKLLLLTALALALTTQGHGPKLRRFTVSAYCHCRVCTHRGDGITASGVRVREGITIAAPRSIPFGTRIWVPGAGWRTVQDRLSRRYDHRLDIYFTSHKRRTPVGHQNSNLHNQLASATMNASDSDKSIIQRMSDQALCATYLQTNKDSLCNIFGHNARIYGNQVVEELTSRGIKQIPNIFGAIQIKPFRLR